MLNVFITIYFRVSYCRFFGVKWGAIFRFPNPYMEIILKCSSFHPVFKKPQSHLDGAFTALILCDFFHSFFFLLKKNLSLLAPLPWLTLLEMQWESYLMLSLVALVFCWSYGGSTGGLRSGLASSPPISFWFFFKEEYDRGKLFCCRFAEFKASALQIQLSD